MNHKIPTPKKYHQSERGSIFPIVLVICIGLVSVALYFAHTTELAYRGASSDVAARQSQHAIDGAAQYVEYLMLNSGTITSGSSSSTSSSGSSSASSVIGTGTTPLMYVLPDPSSYNGEAVKVGDATFWLIGDAQNMPVGAGNGMGGSSGGTGSLTTASGGPGSNLPSFGLVDEASKININTASATMLENIPNMTTSLAQAIVAWRKTASSGTSSSASSASSSANSTNGTNKGGPFESIFELAQVAQLDGDDPSILYGNDTNLNHVLDPSESGSSTQYNPGIYEYVTVFSREPNIIPGTTFSRINITTGSAAVSSGSSSGSSGGSGGGRGGSSSSGSSSGTPTTLTTLLTTVLGQNRAVEVALNVSSSNKGAQPKSVLEFYMRGKLTADELDELTPYLTMSTGHYKSGLINVNTASETVLECIPGISQQVASQIVSTRQQQSTPYTNLAWVAPLFGTSASGSAAAFQAGPYLTTESFQVSADVAAVGQGGLGYRRTLFVIDASNGAPQIVYRHDMTPLGWALGPNELQAIGSGSGANTTNP
ncbi:MAG TPA: helix-hairpin-helix domain-containing protein [Chthoniobacteraceae bacterium]|nr:helix-hairpin-helix domain-containing protein [Chthoniobacteraceae bacterium]